MKTQKTKEQALLESLRNKLVMLKPLDTYKGKYKVDLLYMEGYGELLFTIRSSSTCALIVWNMEISNLILQIETQRAMFRMFSN